MLPLLLLLAAQERPAPLTLEDFDGATPRAKAVDSELKVQEGAGAWSWGHGGARLVIPVTADLSKYAAVSFEITSEAAAAYEARFASADGSRVLWRRVDAPAGKKTTVTLAFYEFRRTGASARVGRWADVKEFALWARAEGGTARVDAIKLEPASAFAPEAEPVEDLKARVGERARAKETGRVTVVTDCGELDLDSLAAEVEKFWALFCETFALKEPRLEGRTTLVLFERAADYRKFVVDTASKVYAAQAGEPRAQGFTFERYSASSCDGASHRLRPVFFHEVGHQWVAGILDLPAMGGWAHEGICWHLQTRFRPQENLAEEVKKFLAGGRVRPVSDFAAAFDPPDGAGNLQSMLLMRYLLEGHREKMPAVLEALSKGAGLTEVVEKTLGMTQDAFTEGWRRFCGEKYK
jgi:hypothetical protein